MHEALFPGEAKGIILPHVVWDQAVLPVAVGSQVVGIFLRVGPKP